MTVGIRGHPSSVGPNALPYFPNLPNNIGQYGKSPFVSNEQAVPQVSYQNTYSSKDLAQDISSVDPLTFNTLFNSTNYPMYDRNIMVYPIYQPNYDMTSSMQDQVQSNDRATLLRQNSLPITGFDQYLDNSSFDYEKVLETLDLTLYDNQEDFSLEDYADLDKVNEGVDFEVSVKQEKSECEYTDGASVNNEQNPLVSDMFSVENSVAKSKGNMFDLNSTDQALEEPDILNILDPYSTPNFEDLQNTNFQTEVKTESENIKKNCDFTYSSILHNNSFNNDIHSDISRLGLPENDIIQMPVSRFNEFLLSLTPELSNLAKDIRRRGKNKQAARLCRKRKLDNISLLEQTLSQMQEEKSRLLNERQEILDETRQLKSSMDTICGLLMKELNDSVSSRELSVLHHSNGQTILVHK